MMIRAACVAAAGMAFSATAALGGSVSVVQSGLSDAQLSSFVDSDLFVAEARVGDSGRNAQKEAILTGPGGFRSESNVNLGGEPVNISAAFSLSLSSGILSFSFNGVSVPSDLNLGGNAPDALAIRLRGDRQLQSFNYGASLTELSFNGTAVNGFSQVDVDNGGINPGVSSLILDGFDFSQDWTLEGRITFIADELRGAGVGSNPAMQIKGVEMQVIPLPTAAAMGFAGLGLVGLRRRR
jgi:hypothetical protein